MSDPIKLMVALPHHGEVEPTTAKDIVHGCAHFMALPGHPRQLQMFDVEHKNICEARHKLVAHAWQWGATHILWVDPDITFPHDAITRMMNHNVPVVAVNSVETNSGARPTAYVDNDDHTGPLYTADDSDGLEEVERCGLHLMLCQMVAFDPDATPYFVQEPIPPQNIRFADESVFFCRQLRKNRIPILVDQGVSRQVKRVGRFDFSHSRALKALEFRASLTTPQNDLLPDRSPDKKEAAHA